MAMFSIRATRHYEHSLAFQALRWMSSFRDVVPMPAQSILKVHASSSYVNVESATGTETGSIEVRSHMVHRQIIVPTHACLKPICAVHEFIIIIIIIDAITTGIQPYRYSQRIYRYQYVSEHSMSDGNSVLIESIDNQLTTQASWKTTASNEALDTRWRVQHSRASRGVAVIGERGVFCISWKPRALVS